MMNVLALWTIYVPLFDWLLVGVGGGGVGEAVNYSNSHDSQKTFEQAAGQGSLA